jgi:hypothetical protein
MRAQEDHAPVESRIAHARHRDEEFSRQVHGATSFCVLE